MGGGVSACTELGPSFQSHSSVPLSRLPSWSERPAPVPGCFVRKPVGLLCRQLISSARNLGKAQNQTGYKTEVKWPRVSPQQHADLFADKERHPSFREAALRHTDIGCSTFCRSQLGDSSALIRTVLIQSQSLQKKTKAI